MMAGQFVIYDGEVCQVLRIQGHAAGYQRMAPRSDVITLQVVGESRFHYLKNPDPAVMRLTTACDLCKRGPGMQNCVRSGVCVGAIPVLVEDPRPLFYSSSKSW